MQPKDSTPQQTSDGKIQPDEPTMERLRNLAPIGDLLFEVSNDNSEETYFLAKSSLGKFKDGITKLELPPQIMKGMLNLIKYLETKIEKRKRQALGEFSKD